METETRVYLSPLQDEHIDHYMALSDDPELIAISLTSAEKSDLVIQSK